MEINKFIRNIIKENKISLKEETINNTTNHGVFQYNQVLSNSPKDDMFIVNLEINQEYKGKGLFKEFLKEIIATAKSKGFNKITLEPDITKGKDYTKFLFDLYKKYGFTENNDGTLSLGI